VLKRKQCKFRSACSQIRNIDLPLEKGAILAVRDPAILRLEGAEKGVEKLDGRVDH
jgi:hypothetical protein